MTQPPLPFSEAGAGDWNDRGPKPSDQPVDEQQTGLMDGRRGGLTSRNSSEAERLMATPPRDDTGAQTLDRYYFQGQCAARECLAMLSERDIASVVCEHHEDYVVLRRSAPLELVSVKHRELGQGPWTLPKLCDDGGLAHLFDRWVPLQGAAHARLCTNAGVTGGAASLRSACSAAAVELRAGERATDGSTSVIDAAAAALADALLAVRRRREFPAIPLLAAPDEGDANADTRTPSAMQAGDKAQQAKNFLTDVRAFVAVLHLEIELPSRAHMRDVNIARLATPALQRLSRNTDDASSCYDDIVELVMTRSRDRGGRLDAARILAKPLRFAADAELRERIAQRTISRPDVLGVMRNRGRSGRLLPDQAVSPRQIEADRPHDLLERKMRAGGLGLTAVSSARSLRAAWRETWAAFRLDLPGDAAERFDIETRVLELAHQAESEARQQVVEGSYGMAMAEKLRSMLVPDNLGTRLAFELDRRHLLGLAYELCGDCKIWFSDSLDAPGEGAGTGPPASSSPPGAERLTG